MRAFIVHVLHKVAHFIKRLLFKVNFQSTFNAQLVLLFSLFMATYNNVPMY